MSKLKIYIIILTFEISTTRIESFPLTLSLTILLSGSIENTPDKALKNITKTFNFIFFILFYEDKTVVVTTNLKLELKKKSKNKSKYYRQKK